VKGREERAALPRAIATTNDEEGGPVFRGDNAIVAATG